MKLDYHIHTAYSDDSDYLMEEVVKDAILKDIEEICITDHVDYGIKHDWDEVEVMAYRDGMPLANVDYDKWDRELTQLQEKYQSQIRIKRGMEFGMQMHTVARYQKLFRRFPFDFIILSVHQIDDQELWTQDFQKGKSQREYNERYYQEILNLVKNYHNYSVLGHLDLIVRYDQAGTYPFNKLKPLITEILKTIIADGKGLEINTSCYRYGLNDLTPSRDILRLYKELGGKIITIGSDSHKKEHLGAYIETTKSELRNLGFEYYCSFNQMQATYHKL